MILHLLTAAEADKIVTKKEINELASTIDWCWGEFALNLEPEFFELLGNVATIDSDPRFKTASMKAQAMLEMWRNHLESGATRRLLIAALCRKNMTTQAAKVFGSGLVHFVSPL